VRKQRVLLENEADGATLRRYVDPPLGVEQHLIAEKDPARIRLDETGDRAKYRRLPGSRRADEGERLRSDPES
jgi:hypothetical protein